MKTVELRNGVIMPQIGYGLAMVSIRLTRRNARDA